MRSSRLRRRSDRQTAIIPLLNGMRHLDVLDSRFGKRTRPRRPVRDRRQRSMSTVEMVQLAPMFSRWRSASATADVGSRAGHRRSSCRRQYRRRRRARTSCRRCGRSGCCSPRLRASTCPMRAAARPHSGCAGRQGLHPRHSSTNAARSQRPRIMLRARLSSNARQRNADDGRIAAHCLDVPRHQGGCAGSRPITWSAI